MLLACHTDLQTSHSRHSSFPRYDPWPLLHLHLLSAPVSHPSPVLLSTIKLVGYPLYGCATPPHPSSPSLRLSLAIALSLVFFIPLLLYCLHTHILIYFNPTFQPTPPPNQHFYLAILWHAVPLSSWGPSSTSFLPFKRSLLSTTPWHMYLWHIYTETSKTHTQLWFLVISLKT